MFLSAETIMGQKSSKSKPAPAVDPRVFRERQVDDNCRKHAIAAILDEKKVLALAKFELIKVLLTGR